MAADDAERDLPGVVAASLADLLERPRWLVAFSGGLDSTVLLHLLWRLLSGPPGAAAPDPGRQPSDRARPDRARPDRTRPDLLALHVNHGISPHADAWQRHCEALCRQWGIASSSLRVSLPARPPGGLEAAAREARYAALESCQRRGDVLLLGHHRDDQVETIALRLFRSSGLEGLAGMAGRSQRGAGLRVRPLLEQPRAALRHYALQQGLQWLEDESNADRRFSRNFVRHRLLPVMGEHWPDAAGHLLALGRAAADGAALLREVADADLGAAAGADRWGSFLRLDALRGCSPPRLRNAVNAWLHRQGHAALRQRQWPAFHAQLAGEPAGATPRLDVAGGSLRRHRGALYWVPDALERAPLTPADWDLQGPLPWACGTLLAEPGGALAPGRYQVRARRGGERLRPAGARRSLLLKDYLQRAGVPPWWRDRLPLLFRDGRLAAVADLCVAAEFSAAGEGGSAVSGAVPGAAAGAVPGAVPGALGLRWLPTAPGPGIERAGAFCYSLRD